MGCTLPSRRMGSNSSGLTAPSILRLSGRQRLRASIVSLDGFYFSKKFRPQTSCWSKEFRVTRCVVSAIKHLKQLLISACIARLLRRFGSWFTLGRGLFSMPPSGLQVQDWWNDAMRLATAHTKPTLAAILLYTVWNIWNERNRRIFQGLMQTPVRMIFASSSRRWPSGNRRARSEGFPSVVMLLSSLSLRLSMFYVITTIVRTRLLLLLK